MDLLRTITAERDAERREECTSCGVTDHNCTAQVLAGVGACCERCRVTDTHPRPKHDGTQYSTQASFHCTPDDARKLAIELLTAAEKCTRPDQYVRIHSFSKSASAWMVENFIIGPM